MVLLYMNLTEPIRNQKYLSQKTENLQIGA
jgi:hypothetical protein